MLKLQIYLFIILIGLCPCSKLWGQHEVIHDKKIHSSSSIGSRWVMSPVAEPFYLYQLNTKDILGENIQTSLNYYYSFGLRMLKISPKTPHQFGMAVLWSKLNYSVPRFNVVEVANSSVDVRINYSHILRQRLEKKTYLKLNSGLFYRYIYQNHVLLSAENPNSSRSSSIWRNNQVFGLAGFGLSGYTFRNSPTGNYWEFSLNGIFSFFSSGGLYHQDQLYFDPRGSELFKARNNLIGFELSWRQYLDMRKNRFVASLKRNPLITKPDKIEWFRPPICFSEPTRELFGGFFVESVTRGGIDSMNVQYGQEASLVGDMLSHNAIGAGYSLHFWGNYRRNQLYYTGDKGIRRSMFLSAGVQHNAALFHMYDGDYVRQHLFGILGSGGMRVGFGSGYYITGNYRYFHPIREQIFSANGNTDLIPSQYFSNHGGELSIGYRNVIRVGVVYLGFRQEAQESLPIFQTLALSLKVGH